jgi:D-glycero-alpha-D-manno-heptose-7-phosphate kinase
MDKPVRIINSAAPIRICDNGGWTDTWFAGHGQIFNIGVYPYAEVQITVRPGTSRQSRITLHAENYGERYEIIPEKHWDKHPLLEAAIEFMRVPPGLDLEVTIFSEAPAGASTGTSAAVTVALIGALNQLNPSCRTLQETAEAAHRIETDMLGLQSGIQDQICSAFGGVNYIEMDSYPHSTITPLQVPNPTWWELERRLALIYLGKGHHSSEVHEEVIRGLKEAGTDCQQLNDLRSTAAQSRDALLRGDFLMLGQSMVANTEAQARLHPTLVCSDAKRVIEIAKDHGAVGWKVNGAGGEGGSVTLLCSAEAPVKRAMLRTIEQDNPLFKNIRIYLSRFGLRVWEQS